MERGRSFLLTAKFFLLAVGLCRLWSFALVFLLTVENRFGLFYLRFPPSGNWVGSFLLTVPPRPEIGFGLFYLPSRRHGHASVGPLYWSFLLTVPPLRKLGWVFSAYGSPPSRNWFWSFFCLPSRRHGHASVGPLYKKWSYLFAARTIFDQWSGLPLRARFQRRSPAFIFEKKKLLPLHFTYGLIFFAYGGN